MRIKKILAGVTAIAMIVSSLAVRAFATDYYIIGESTKYYCGVVTAIDAVSGTISYEGGTTATIPISSIKAEDGDVISQISLIFEESYDGGFAIATLSIIDADGGIQTAIINDSTSSIDSTYTGGDSVFTVTSDDTEGYDVTNIPDGAEYTISYTVGVANTDGAYTDGDDYTLTISGEEVIGTVTSSELEYYYEVYSVDTDFDVSDYITTDEEKRALADGGTLWCDLSDENTVTDATYTVSFTGTAANGAVVSDADVCSTINASTGFGVEIPAGYIAYDAGGEGNVEDYEYGEIHITVTLDGEPASSDGTLLSVVVIEIIPVTTTAATATNISGNLGDFAYNDGGIYKIFLKGENNGATAYENFTEVTGFTIVLNWISDDWAGGAFVWCSDSVGWEQTSFSSDEEDTDCLYVQSGVPVTIQTGSPVFSEDDSYAYIAVMAFGIVDLYVSYLELLDADGNVLASYSADILYGDTEGQGNLRIEIANEYGIQDARALYSDLSFNGGIAVTFTISGLTSTDDYEAFLMYVDLNWKWGNWSADEFPAGTATVNGDGTYTVYIDNSISTAYKTDEETGESVLITASGAEILCVDIIGLAEAEGLEAYSSESGLDHGNITVSDVIITTWNDGESPFDTDTDFTEGTDEVEAEVAADEAIVIESEELGVTLEADAGTFGESILSLILKIVTEIVQETVSAIETAVAQIDENAEVAVNNKLSISLYDQDGAEVQPVDGGKVKVTVPYDGVSNAVVYVSNDAKEAEFFKLIDNGDGTVSFETTHFSDYYLVTVDETSLVEVVAAGTVDITEDTETLPGDLDGNGDVNPWDSVLLARYLASWDVDIDESAADLDGDSEVTLWDSVLLARQLAGWGS